MKIQTDTKTNGARVFPIPPPLYYGLAFGAGALLDSTIALPIGARPTTTLIGTFICIVGLTLTAGGVGAVIRHRTTIIPHHAVATLITTGAYRLSRNPMYSGLAFTYLGGALLLGSWWPIFWLPPVLLLVTLVAIAPEERYLTQRFGQQYTTYCVKVRRWI